MTTLQDFPQELLLEILSSLVKISTAKEAASELLKIQLLSREFHEISNDSTLWKTICRKKHAELGLHADRSLWSFCEFHPQLPVHKHLHWQLDDEVIAEIAAKRSKLYSWTVTPRLILETAFAYKSWLSPQNIPENCTENGSLCSNPWKFNFYLHLKDLQRDYITEGELTSYVWDFRFRHPMTTTVPNHSVQTRHFGIDAFGPIPSPNHIENRTIWSPSWNSWFEKDGIYRGENFFEPNMGFIILRWRCIDATTSTSGSLTHWSEKKRMVQVSHYIPHEVFRDENGGWVIRNSAVVFRNIRPRGDDDEFQLE